MQRRALVLEAYHTTHIEGARLAFTQAERLLGGEAVVDAPRDDALELLNYRDAFELVSEYLDSGEPITEGLFREIHRWLVKVVRGDSAEPASTARCRTRSRPRFCHKQVRPCRYLSDIVENRDAARPLEQLATPEKLRSLRRSRGRSHRSDVDEKRLR